MIPKDPFMLLSYINTQLRDNYESLEELCDAMGLSAQEILDKLEKVGYRYDAESNRFSNL